MKYNDRDSQHMNRQYLEKAAASVAILVERYLDGSDNSYNFFPTKITTEELSRCLTRMRSNGLDNYNYCLEELIATFNLSDTEIFILLVCVAVELIPSFNRLCGSYHGRQNQDYLTLGFITSMVENFAYSAIAESSNLLVWQLLRIEKTLNCAKRTSPLVIDASVLDYLLGIDYYDSDIATIVNYVPSNQLQTEAVSDTDPGVVRQISSLYKKTIAEQDNATVQLTGTDITNKEQLVKTIAGELNSSLIELSYFRIPFSSDQLSDLKVRLERWMKLNKSLLVIKADDLNSDDKERNKAIKELVSSLRLPMIISSVEPINWGTKNNLSLEISVPDSTAQIVLWHQYLASGLTPELEPELPKLVAQFNLTAPAISAIASRLVWGVHPRQSTFEKLWDECRIAARQNLDGLATRVSSNASWDNLILPDSTKEKLASIISQVNQRARVYQEWGFSSHRGSGITALFSGTSGTGKTTAAEVIANELKLDLYKIELSTVISKYIGETEKNLRKIFDAAEAGGAILLFDEADALFGKRTEVKDSKDRHSNAEISYLLQKMESYRGLAILTTNIKDAIDTAFKRRLRFVVDFAFPDPIARERIWRSVFPKATPTEGLNYELLARLDLTGGNIRSIALNAAFEASSANEPIQMKHIVNAAKSEAQKLGSDTYELEMMVRKLGLNREHSEENSSVLNDTMTAQKDRSSTSVVRKEHHHPELASSSKKNDAVVELTPIDSGELPKTAHQSHTTGGKYAHLSVEQIINSSRRYLEVGDYKTAYEIFREGLITYPNDCSLNFGLGELAHVKKLPVPPQEILTAFERAEKGTGDWLDNHEGLATTWYWQALIRDEYKIGDVTTIRKLYGRYIQAQPKGQFIEHALNRHRWFKSQEVFPGIGM